MTKLPRMIFSILLLLCGAAGAETPDEWVTLLTRVHGGLKYTVPMSMLPKLGQINSTIQNPRERHDAVMAIADLYTVETLK